MVRLWVCFPNKTIICLSCTKDVVLNFPVRVEGTTISWWAFNIALVLQEALDNPGYPLVICYMDIENGNVYSSEFSP